MDKFLSELEVGEIHFRDREQFELKSEFFPLPALRKNVYTQEFYFFIPNALQIHDETYSKAQFYRDLTNLIRYKTPSFSLEKLYDPSAKKSPLMRLQTLAGVPLDGEHVHFVQDELKLLGNVVRSALRERINRLIQLCNGDGPKSKELEEGVRVLCSEVMKLRETYLDIQTKFLKTVATTNLKSQFLYVDEFISNAINYYFAGFLEQLQKSPVENKMRITESLNFVLAWEKTHRKEILKEPPITDEDTESNEYVLYRSGLLNKFVIDALLLNCRRTSLMKRFGNIVGSIAAGIAMLVFFVLFVKGGQVFLINSISFIVITVLLYVLKDRIKEGLKTISYRLFAKWFSDFNTDINTPDGEHRIGRIRESVSFVDESELPQDIIDMRDREFHAVLEEIKRPEQVLYYKKKITLFKQSAYTDPRRRALNLIFRFNIRHFLSKADSAKHRYVTVNPETRTLVHAALPKVYHVNIILRNTYLDSHLKEIVELKKFRLVLDKNGIKRVEHLR